MVPSIALSVFFFFFLFEESHKLVIFPVFVFVFFVFVNWADPVHTAAEQARQDSAGEVLHSSRGIREAQGRI